MPGPRLSPRQNPTATPSLARRFEQTYAPWMRMVHIQSMHSYGPGDGTPVLLMPSLGRGAGDFNQLGEALALAGFHALAVQPRGVAKTLVVPPATTLHDSAADLVTLIELRGAGPVHTVGHAFGNRVVRTLATDHPDLVRSVTLLGCGGQVEPGEAARAAFPKCFDANLPEAERLAAIQTCFFAPGNAPAAWREGWYPAIAAAQRHAVAGTPNAEYRAAGSAPVLNVQGLDDALAVPENGRILKAEMGDRAELVELANCGHAMLPEQPAAIAESVIRFLRAH